MRYLLTLLLLCGASLAQADIYKCTQADGSLLYADSPCPSSASGARMSQQQLDSRTSNLGKLAPSNDAAHKPDTSITSKLESSLDQVSAQKLPQRLQQKLPPALQQRTQHFTWLAWLSLGLILIGGIWLLVAAFQVGIWWGLGCLLLPIVPLVFVILHWAEAKRPFLLQVLGFALLVASILLSL